MSKNMRTTYLVTRQQCQKIVVPMLDNDQLIGVLDIDSSKTSSYDEIDQLFLEKFAASLVAARRN